MSQVTPRLILASQSPRRAALLKDAGIAHEMIPTKVDERAPRKKTPREACIEIAGRKANAIQDKDAWILAADTVIDHEGRILGKPADEMEAHAMLRMLSGGWHDVYTGVVIRAPGKDPVTGVAHTKVTFREITDAEIDAYIRTGDPMDKAGAYGIQGKAKVFVTKVEGPMDNVIGLPVDVVRALLKQTGYPL